MTPRKRIVNQIKASNIFNEVAGAASIPSALENTNVLPGCYVVEITERSHQNTFLDGVHQQTILGFEIVIIIENITDDFGEDSSDQMTELRKKLKQKILGFTPIEDDDAMLEYAGGRMISFEDDQLVWAETYQISTLSSNEI